MSKDRGPHLDARRATGSARWQPPGPAPASARVPVPLPRLQRTGARSVRSTPVGGPGFHVIGCDRPWMTADATIPGRLYVSFVDHSDGSGGELVPNVQCKTSTATNQFFSCGRQYVTSSRDGGKTWKPFAPVDSAARAGRLHQRLQRHPGRAGRRARHRLPRRQGTGQPLHHLPGLPDLARRRHDLDQARRPVDDRRTVARCARPQPAGGQLVAGLPALPRPGPRRGPAATPSCTSTPRSSSCWSR